MGSHLSSTQITVSPIPLLTPVKYRRGMFLADVLPDAPTTTDDALALFDASAAAETEFMIGTWHGAELPTGHPLDGLLEASGWWGKQFVDAESVHPLLFTTSDGRALWAVNPILAFSGLGAITRIPALKHRNHAGIINAAGPILGTRSPKARLRTTRYRGVDTATMIYDQLPINDVFRKLDDRTVIGAMDLRGSTRPYFFVLTRDDSLRLR
jgi:Domain of unknown function (DUF4334)/GXWXG protein